MCKIVCKSHTQIIDKPIELLNYILEVDNSNISELIDKDVVGLYTLLLEEQEGWGNPSSKDEERRENKKKGLLYELYIGLTRSQYKYNNDIFEITYRGIMLGKKDGGIDLIVEADKEIFLYQCKNWKSKITQKEIKVFLYDCMNYILLNRSDKVYKFVFSSNSVFDIGARNFNGCINIPYLGQSKIILEYNKFENKKVKV